MRTTGGASVDIEAADHARIAVAVVDDDDLAAALVAADTAQQLAVAADHGDHLRCRRAGSRRCGCHPDDRGLDVARTIAEAVHLAVTDILLSAGIANDDPAGLGDDGAAALLALAALAAEVVEALRSGRLRTRGNGLIPPASGGGAAGSGAVT